MIVIKTSDIHGLFQEDYGFMNEPEIVHQPYGVLCQPNLYHVFQDPVAIYIDLRFLRSFSLLEFEIKVEHALQIKFLLEMINSFLISIYP